MTHTSMFKNRLTQVRVCCSGDMEATCTGEVKAPQGADHAQRAEWHHTPREHSAGKVPSPWHARVDALFGTQVATLSAAGFVMRTGPAARLCILTQQGTTSPRNNASDRQSQLLKPTGVCRLKQQ